MPGHRTAPPSPKRGVAVPITAVNSPDQITRMSSCKPPWAAHLKPVGLHYYGGVAHDVKEILEKHKIAHGHPLRSLSVLVSATTLQAGRT